MASSRQKWTIREHAYASQLILLTLVPLRLIPTAMHDPAHMGSMPHPPRPISSLLLVRVRGRPHESNAVHTTATQQKQIDWLDPFLATAGEFQVEEEG